MKRLLGFLRHWRNWLGLLLLLILGSMALATPKLAPQEDPSNPQLWQQVGRPSDPIPRPPSSTALLGTLPNQYDVFFTLMWGLRQAFQFGLTVTLVTGAFGVLYGATSAYLGGVANNIMMRIADAFLTFPILAAIVFMTQIISVILNQVGMFDFYRQMWWFSAPLSAFQQLLLKFDPVAWALILFSWMPYARLVNASVLRLRKVEFVTSARALGAGHARIILRHLLPNAISPEIVLAARDVGGMVILQATFAFIGLGGYSPWGELLARGRSWIVGPGGNPFMYWWTYLPATILLIFFSVSWNFMGDNLNEWLNPRKSA
jgi:peptide/nickel transport system permease protein